ncbi:hypothetical protein M3P21_20090 [Ruegeria sp. 2012CJ41-6]|uniref:N-formylglutamate amidohydrolase n=1 Tax=Ruegeria spongiae TaxID=2942209 RepID=A0ABT0Q7H4_9RHOB|nr:hypothetical protein [Ruegeria spongiae]MCL6285826.1 hypothetical protein [Ruegeria spongiae]
MSKADHFPVKLFNKTGKGAFVFGCEHAGYRIPNALRSLGLSKAEQARHIAWGVGAAQLTEKPSKNGQLGRSATLYPTGL